MISSRRQILTKNLTHRDARGCGLGNKEINDKVEIAMAFERWQKEKAEKGNISCDGASIDKPLEGGARSYL